MGLTEAQERINPGQAGIASAYGRPADTDTGHGAAYSPGGDVIQMKISVTVGVLPESGKIGLVPDLHRPLGHFLCTVPGSEMFQGVFHQQAPLQIIRGRRDIALPVKDRLGAAAELRRHEAQFEKGTQSQFEIGVHNPVEVGKVIPCDLSVIGAHTLIDADIVAEQSVPADIAEMTMLLNKAQLIHILPVQRKAEASGADAV